MAHKIERIKIFHNRQSGQALVQGILIIFMIVSLTVVGVLFLCNVGMSVYYKEKLTFAANQAAEYAFTQAPGPKRKSQTEAFVNEFLQKAGLAPRKLAVTMDDTGTIGGQPVIKVTIVNNCNLLGSGNILPAFIAMSSTGFASSPTTIVGAPGPPGPAGPRGPAGPPGPPGRLAPIDPARVKSAVGLKGFVNIRYNSASGSGVLQFPIFDSNVEGRGNGSEGQKVQMEGITFAQ